MQRLPVALLVIIALVLAACGADDGAGGAAEGEGATTDVLRVVVTTSVLGDIVEDVLASTSDTSVEVLLPPGADPHGYAPSAADALALREADVVYAIGLGLEEALEDTLEAAEEDGVRVVRLGPSADPISADPGLAALHDGHSDDEDHGDEDHSDEDDHADEDHSDEDDHADEGDHAEGGLDPHVWLDPIRAGMLATAVAEVHAELAPADAAAVTAAAEAYVDRMAALDEELAAALATIPADRRQLVTNHEALGYLADRYDLEVLATVLPGTTADVDVTAASFTELVELVQVTGVPAIFAETTASDRLARALAEEVGDVEVVELYTGSLGEPGSGADTLEGMLRVDVERIVDALA